MGIATRIAVRLIPDPPAVRTLLLDFMSIEDAGRDRERDHRRRHRARRARDDGRRDHPRGRGLRRRRLPARRRGGAARRARRPRGRRAKPRSTRSSRVGSRHGARTVRVAADDAERALLWKGRKSAFGAIARIAPDYYLHDAVVPRTKLVDVLREVYAIAREQRLTMMNVFHAGDGNLHPLIVFDAREPGIWERVHAAGDEILRACVAAGGVLSGEHGIGLEKRDAMPLVFSADDLDAQARLRDAFDPSGRANPGKVLPAGQPVRRARSGSPRARGSEPRSTARRASSTSARRSATPQRRVDSRRRPHALGGRRPAARATPSVRAPAGIVAYDPADLTVMRRGGHDGGRARRRARRRGPGVRARSPRCRRATVGGDARGRALGHAPAPRTGPLRDRVLEVRFVTADGRLVQGGGPTVKNVTRLRPPAAAGRVARHARRARRR